MAGNRLSELTVEERKEWIKEGRTGSKELKLYWLEQNTRNQKRGQRLKHEPVLKDKKLS